jgi:hypothetical protein
MNTTFVIATITAATLIGAAFVIAAQSTEVKASAPSHGNSDSLPVQKFGPSCSQEAWPFYESECVRDHRQASGQAAKVRHVSFVRL